MLLFRQVQRVHGKERSAFLKLSGFVWCFRQVQWERDGFSLCGISGRCMKSVGESAEHSLNRVVLCGVSGRGRESVGESTGLS